MARPGYTSVKLTERAASSLHRMAEKTGLAKATLIGMAIEKLAAWVDEGWRPPQQEPPQVDE